MFVWVCVHGCVCVWVWVYLRLSESERKRVTKKNVFLSLLSLSEDQKVALV